MDSSVKLTSLLLEGFSFTSLNKLSNNPNKADQYLLSTLDFPLGKGASRKVYDLENGKVIKLAYTGENADNQREWINSRCLGESYCPKVYTHAVNYLWIVVEKVNQIKYDHEFVSLIEKKLKVKPGHYDDSALVELFTRNGPGFDALHPKLYGKNQWYTTLYDGLNSCNINKDDFYPRNWGVRPSTGELLLVDLGM